MAQHYNSLILSYLFIIMIVYFVVFSLNDEMVSIGLSARYAFIKSVPTQ